jgi:hypothetical protein
MKVTGVQPRKGLSSVLLKGGLPGPAPVVPHPESLAAQAAYTEALVPGSGLGPNCFPALGSDPGLLNRGTQVTAAAANLEKIKVYTFFLLTGAWLEAAQDGTHLGRRAWDTSRSPWDRAKVKGTECQGRERATGPPRTAGVAGHVGCHSGAYQHTG